MPEITKAEQQEFNAYQALGGTPRDLKKQISDLEKDNKGYRDEIKTLKENQPKDDQVIVSKADADLLEKYKEHGKPDEIKGKLEEGTKAQASLKERDARDSAAAFVKAAGLASESVDTLVALPALKDAKFEVRKVKVKDNAGNETEQEVAYLTLAGDGEKAMTFSDAGDKISALKGLRTAEPEKGGQQNGTRYVQQGSGSQNKGSKSSTFDRIRESAKAKKEETAKQETTKTPMQSVSERLGMA